MTISEALCWGSWVGLPVPPLPALTGTLSPSEGERERERGPTSIPGPTIIQARGSRDPSLVATFPASAPGDYEVTVHWLDSRSNTIVRSERLVYHLDKEFKADRVRLGEVNGELQALGRQVPDLSGLNDYFQAEASAALERARRTKSVADFDDWHRKADCFVGLARYCREQGVQGGLLVRQISNPWDGFDAAEFFRGARSPANSISGHLLGNAYESAAIALTNLRPGPTTLRLSCGPFDCGTNRVAARQVLELRQVLTVAPNGTDEPVEDALPLLGEGDTVRLEPSETRKVWLTFRSQALPPGSWHAVLKAATLPRRICRLKSR